jgi:hypothetical protein
MNDHVVSVLIKDGVNYFMKPLQNILYVQS